MFSIFVLPQHFSMFIQAGWINVRLVTPLHTTALKPTNTATAIKRLQIPAIFLITIV